MSAHELEVLDGDLADRAGLDSVALGWLVDNISAIEDMVRYTDVGFAQETALFIEAWLTGLSLTDAIDQIGMEAGTFTASRLDEIGDRMVVRIAELIARDARVKPPQSRRPYSLTALPPVPPGWELDRWLRRAFEQLRVYREEQTASLNRRLADRATEAGFGDAPDPVFAMVMARAKSRREQPVAGRQTVRLGDLGTAEVDLADLTVVPVPGPETLGADLFGVIQVIAASQAARSAGDLSSVGLFLLALQIADATNTDGVPDTVREAAIAEMEASINRVRNDRRVVDLGAFLADGDQYVVAEVRAAAQALGVDGFLDEAGDAVSLNDADLESLFGALTGGSSDDATAVALDAAIQARRSLDAQSLWERAATLWERAGSEDAAARCRDLAAAGGAGPVVTWDSLEIQFLEDL